MKRVVEAMSASSYRLAWVIAQVAITPIVIGSAGPSGYGIFALGLTAYWVMFGLDLGLGLAHQVRISRSHRTPQTAWETEDARRSLVRWSGGLTSGACVMLAVSIMFTGMRDTALSALALGAMFGALALPTSLSFRGRLAVKRTRLSSVLSVCAAGVSVLVVWAMSASVSSGLVFLSAVCVIRQGSLLLDWRIYRREWLNNGMALPSSLSNDTKVLGRQFFVLQTAAILSFNLDVLIVGTINGDQAVAQLSIVSRIVLIIPMLVGLLIQPLMTTYAETDDAVTLRKGIVKSTLTISAVAGLGLVLVITFRHAIVDVWLGNEQFPIQPGLWMVVAIFALIAAASGPITLFIQSRGALNSFTRVTVIGLVINVVLSVSLACHWGPIGPVAASIATQAALILPASLLLARREFRKLPRNSSPPVETAGGS